ncbi:MAG TPA: hypothetical protein VF815_19905 [Myxococcaceae bacterium]|jgi:hypothetical protein
MVAHRTQQGLGWLSVGLGLTELTFAEGICRVLGARGRAGVVRLLGARELFTGVGLLSQKNAQPWVWGRVAGDAIDLALLGTTLGRARGSSAWRFTTLVSVLGITLVDILTATGTRIPQRSVKVSNLNPGVPMESWRGSGLAEDVGMRQQRGEPQADEEERQQRMKDAQRQLGLPDPEEISPRT